MWSKNAMAFEEYLGPGERLLWSGQPKQGLILRGSDIFLVPFTLLWGGFAIFWEVSVIASGAPFFFTLWGVPFVLVGLYLMAGRFVVDALQRANTTYALTNERVIILSGLIYRQVKSINLRTLSDLTLSQAKGGRGTITLGPTSPLNWFYAGAAWPGRSQHLSPTLELIDEAKLVYDQIREIQQRR